MTDKELVRRDIEALYLGDLRAVALDVRLPDQGENGSQITWKSDHPAVMDHRGRVTRPAYGRGNRTVMLTARFVYGSCTEERQYAVTVLEKENDIQVEEVLPIAVSAVQGERTHLPSVSAVRTRDGRVTAHFLEWDGGLERVWERVGIYQVHGRLRDTQIPAVCWVQVRESGWDAGRAADVPVRRERSASAARVS